MEKIIGALPITNSDLQMMLGELIVQEGPYNRMGIKLLLEGIIKENPNACTWLTAFMIGRRIPNIPDVGSIGYLKLESLKYNSHYQEYEGSVYNRQGYIPCTVENFSGLHNYNPIKVILPTLDLMEEPRIIGLNLDEFFPLKDVDYYDKDWELPF
jgi:hypothetical protein